MTLKAFFGPWTKTALILLTICTIPLFAVGQQTKNSFFYDLQYEAGINLGIYSGEIAPAAFFSLHKPFYRHVRGEFLLGVYNNISPTNFAFGDLNSGSENFRHTGYQSNLQLFHPSLGYRAYFLKNRLNLGATVSGGYHLFTTRAEMKSEEYDIAVRVNNSEHYFTAGILASLGYKLSTDTYLNFYAYRNLGDQQLINPVFLGLGLGWNLTGSKKTR